MANQNFTPKKVMGVFELVMINVIAVDSLRSLPTTASYGFSVVFYYIVAGLLFFIPTALIAGELATGWPKTGGIYVWAKEAYNKEMAFVLICLQWIYNICWYPTILSLMAGALAYCINPDLANNPWYMFFTISGLFWLIALLNCFGMKFSNYFSSFSAIIGTLIPIGFVILLGILWLSKGQPSQIHFTTTEFLPDFNNLNSLAFLTSVLFSLVGMEMSGIHAQEVRDPNTQYPKAIFISAMLILASFIFASLAIAVVVPKANLNLVTGLLEAYHLFFAYFHMEWMMPIVALLIVIGGAGGVGAWLLGPVKALLVASEDGLLPQLLSKVNRFNAPYRLILIQGTIFMILTSAFLFMPSVSASFWLLSVLTSQLSLIFYIGLFAVAIRLRYKHPEVKRAFRVPFGNKGMWALVIAGIMSCLFTLGVGFLPPPNMHLGSLFKFEAFLIIGIVVACVIPFMIAKFASSKN